MKLMRKSLAGELGASVGKGCLFPSLIMRVQALELMQQNRRADVSKFSSDLYTQHVAPPPRTNPRNKLRHNFSLKEKKEKWKQQPEILTLRD